jgi:hypothetical protein
MGISLVLENISFAGAAAMQAGYQGFLDPIGIALKKSSDPD